jgi:hypothetical protein
VRSKPWLVLAAGTVAILGVLGASGRAYWEYVRFVPHYVRPHVVLPVPNAYDDFVAAGALCRAAGGADVSPVGSANVATYPPRQGYEEGVPMMQIRAVVAHNRRALARLRQGFGKEYRNPPVTSFEQSFPELVGFRKLAGVLLAEGKLAEREGRMRDAARSYLDCLRLGVEVPQGGLVIHGLVGIAIQRMGLQALQQTAGRLDATTTGAAARAMLRLDRGATTAADALQQEKEMSHAAIADWLRREPEEMELGWPNIRSIDSDYIPTTVMALRYSLIPRRQMLENNRAYMEAYIADARRPVYASSSLPPIPDDLLNRQLLPVLENLKWKWADRDAHWRITELRLAARAYQVRYGAAPASAQALVPEYLPSVPRDPFADRPLVYRRAGRGAVVYSRGPDGDDDGGKLSTATIRPDSDGDIVRLKPTRF